MPLIEPEFLDTDVDTIVQECIDYYESLTGKTLNSGQAERLVINLFAYRESLLKIQINNAAKQNLVDFSIFPILDYLAALMGVERLTETPAKCVVEFTLVAGHGDVVIPEGTRVSTSDGKFVFETTDPIEVLTGTDTVSATLVCQVPGVSANNYLAGNVNIINDPQAFLESAENTTTTAGGGDAETDEQLRERVKLAPDTFSTAGPTGAYKFHALSADPSIIDVKVTSPVPGTVNIYPLVEGGITTPQDILDAVFDKCNPENVRPLTDTVVVISPTKVDYAVEIELTLYDDANQTLVEAAVLAAVTEFTEARKRQLGKDVLVASQIRAKAMQDGVYDAVIILPAADLILAGTEFANCTSILITTTGLNEG